MVGTILTLAVVTGLVASATLAYATRASTRASEPPPSVGIGLAAAPGNAFVTLTHAGGSTPARTDVRAVVTVDGAVAHDAALPGPALTWAIGDADRLALSTGPLAGGAVVEAAVVFTPTGVSIAGASLPVPRSAPAPSSQFTVRVFMESGSNSTRAEAGSATFVGAEVIHPEGRKAIRSVVVNLSALRGPTSLALRDDGLLGDALAGDSNWSGFVDVPLGLPQGPKRVVVTATDADGAERKAFGTIRAFEAGGTAKYNSTFIKDFGLRILKYDAGAPRRDRVTVTAKLRVPQDNVVELPNGTRWELKRVHFAFDRFKSTDIAEHELNFQAASPDYGYACFDAGAPPARTNNMVFKLDNVSIDEYVWDRDSLRYTVKTVWYKLPISPTSPTLPVYVTTWEYDPNFVTTRLERTALVLDGGWPTSWNSCTAE